MTLIRDTSASDPNEIHRVKEFSDRKYISYCGQEISISNARPASRSGSRCRQCLSYYKINQGKPPATHTLTTTEGIKS
jgi:hypothetical protein